jgi:hypothetical protein
MNNNLIVAAQQLREAGNATVLAILALENEGDKFADTIVQLKLQAGDSFVAVEQIEQLLGEAK